MKALTNHYIAKIEGHGHLKINFQKNEVKLEILEGQRLFEGMVLGRPYQDGPYITARICGVCPTAHTLASIKSIENAFQIEVNSTIKNLRRILLNAQIIQSHLLHLVFLSLGDYLDTPSVTSLASKYPAEFHLALELKKTAEETIKTIGGRAIHPLTPIIGGFTKLPNREQLVILRGILEIARPKAIDLGKIFSNLPYPNLKNPTEYLALKHDEYYSFDQGMVYSSERVGFDPELYRLEIEEQIQPYSTAKIAKRENHSFMVGALARVNLHHHQLLPSAKKILNLSGLIFPSNNSFYNLFAQSLEIIHCLEDSVNLINEILSSPIEDSQVDYDLQAGEGTGAIEAPRGTLYHHYAIDKKGKISACNIITPTVQNLFNIEQDARVLLKETKNQPQEKREKLLEMLVRAYDPCITCSVH
jgi:coenzyme F420-reducing hydrogenase alpha subunit